MHSKEADGCRLCRYRRVQEKRPDRDCLNGEVTVYLTLTFVLFVSLDTGSCGKCVGADGKELQAGRYEPGIGMCICRISERITGKL